MSFDLPNTVILVVVGCGVLGAVTGFIGTFTYLRKRALIGDMIAHSVLPGVALAFMVSGTKDPLILLIGALIAGWVSILLMDLGVQRSGLRPDSAIASILSVFFGIGTLLLTHIQHAGYAAQSGLDEFLFGSAASMSPRDVYIFGTIGLIASLFVLLLYKELTITVFDREQAQSRGFKVKGIEFLLNTLTVLAVASGIQAVGVVLIAALLITPPSAANSWTKRLPYLLLLASLFGAFSGVAGALISYSAPGMPTGPWVVVVLFAVIAISVTIAPSSGLIARWKQQRRNQNKILEENILKALFKLAERDQDLFGIRRVTEIQRVRELSHKDLKKGLRSLSKKGSVAFGEERVGLTKKGKEEAERVVRLHRLWELYLTTHMQLGAASVHPGAEAIEHIITPEVEQALEKRLGYPDKDPHSSPIPPKKEKD